MVALDNLDDVPIAINASNKDALPFRPAARFELPVVLTNNGQTALEWSNEKALNLSYRWLGKDGEEVIERDGLRTTIHGDAMAPGARVEIELGGVSPEGAGIYQLQISLVLEGVHWACDIGSTGWIQLLVQVAPAPAWPPDLKISHGGRALRGAIIAAQLSRQLSKAAVSDKFARTLVLMEIAAPKSAVAKDASTVVRRLEAQAHGIKDWLRRFLGIRGLEHQLKDVVAAANRQETHSQELEQQISLLRDELQSGPKALNTRAPQLTEDLAEARKSLRSHLTLSARRNTFSDGTLPSASITVTKRQTATNRRKRTT